MSDKNETKLEHKDAKQIGRIVHKDGSVSIVEGCGFPGSDAVWEKILEGNLWFGKQQMEPETKLGQKFKNESS